MKTFKKSVCLLLAFAMCFTVTACRRLRSNGSSYLSDSDSQVIMGEVEIIEDNGGTAASTGGSKGSKGSNDKTSSSHTSGSQNHSSSGDGDAAHSQGKLPSFSKKQFDLSGFWAPYDISEAGLKLYKDVGFTTLAMINHSGERTSDEQFYLGSNRTLKALEGCKKVGLKAILNYNDWIAISSSGNKNYYSNKPFSQYDIYGEYKDIITGIHIVDEPHKKDHFPVYSQKTLIDDFKNVYPNADYIVNLIPYTAYADRGFSSYEEMMEMYENLYMSQTKNPYVSVDVYPFHEGNTRDDQTLAMNYEYIAAAAKKYGVKPCFILQASVGGGEFEMQLDENDLRWEINAALAFGADKLQYYCYSVPRSYENGKYTYMYDNCILNQDDTPSQVYYDLQKLHKEIQSFADVILSYDWDQSIGVTSFSEKTYRVGSFKYYDDREYGKLQNAKYFASATASRDLVISRFESKQHGEAYMFVNFTDRGKTNNVVATFKDCGYVAVYGGSKWSSTPKIEKLDKDGKLKLDLKYGEGAFIIPLV